MFNISEFAEYKERIDTLNRTAWGIRISDSDKAYGNSQQAALLSKEINYEKGLADALSIQAFGYIRKSNFNRALECLNEATSIYDPLLDFRGLAIVNEYFGIVHRNKGNSALALEYIFKAIQLSRQTGFTEHEVTNLYQAGVTYKSLANYNKALDYLFQSLSLARSIDFTLMTAYNFYIIGSIYFETSDYEQALDYYKQGLSIRKKAGDKWGEAGSLDNIGFTYLKLNDYPQAIEYCKASFAITISTEDKKGQANTLFHLAEASQQNGDLQNAKRYSDDSLSIRKQTGDRRGEVEILVFSAGLEIENQQEIFDKLLAASVIAKEINTPDLLSKIHFQLYKYYERIKNFEEAFSHLQLYMELEKQLHKDAINQKIANFEIVHKAEEIKKEAETIKLRNEELNALNNEIEDQKKRLEQALQKLQSTQAQLIQSEKMASLGELTAGIAHEIQNPLNFVNNFSEVSNELIVEMKEELSKGNYDDANAIADDIKQNLEKINHHGKRADAIVKGMLQHSRSSSAEKEPTDINALVDEYLRLCYHGLRAKDKSFNATLKTDFDNTIGNINIIPQDIGRVVLNLLTNAFYVVDEKKKSGIENYEPTVSVSTKKISEKVEIKVSDNGNGIPQKVMDKIFQPFFTTKPTGQGTGLGLSLSYDIIKAHGGEIKVETREGEGTTFIISITALL